VLSLTQSLNEDQPLDPHYQLASADSQTSIGLQQKDEGSAASSADFKQQLKQEFAYMLQECPYPSAIIIILSF
jgi:hypothetical protein